MAKREPLDTSCIELVMKLKRLSRLGLKGKELATELGRLRMQFLEETSKMAEVKETGDVAEEDGSISQNVMKRDASEKGLKEVDNEITVGEDSSITMEEDKEKNNDRSNRKDASIEIEF